MVEEYSIFPRDFLDSLKRHVIAPLDTLLITRDVDEVVSIFSLFSAFDSEGERLIDISDMNYSKYHYENDRGKLNLELKALGMYEHKSKYRMNVQEKVTGRNAAILFHIETVEAHLVPFLRHLLEKENDRLYWNMIWKIMGFPGEKEKYLDLELEFPANNIMKRKEIQPSLINRIGFYDDEDYDESLWGVHQLKGGYFLNLITDPRFLFEAGEYEEERQWWCQNSTKHWVYEECMWLYDEETEKHFLERVKDYDDMKWD